MARVKAAYSHNNDRLLRNGDLNAYGRYPRTGHGDSTWLVGLSAKKNRAKYFSIIDEVDELLATRTFPFQNPP